MLFKCIEQKRGIAHFDKRVLLQNSPMGMVCGVSELRRKRAICRFSRQLLTFF